MQWRNREKRNDQEHHVKASFFHLADKKCLLHFLLLAMLFAFEKMSSSLPGTYLLFVHLANVQTVAHRYSLKQVFLKISQHCIHRKSPVLEPLFNKVSGLKTCIFI